MATTKNLSQFTSSSSSVCPSVVASSARCVQRTTGAAGFCRKNQARKLLKLSQPATRPERERERDRERQTSDMPRETKSK